MSGSLGTIRGQMLLDVNQAIASYTAARLAHLQTVTALRTGGGALMAAGAGIAAMGAGMLAGLMVAVNASADFERRMSYVGAVTGATTEQMDALRTKAIQLGQDTIFSAGQIADSFVELAKSGVTTEDIIGGIGQAVAALGAAADIPLDTAANIIMAAVQTFQLGADQAVHVADLLAGAANASIVDVQDLGVSLKYVGGIASALNIPIESVADALALLGTYGIKGSTAGTSLRQILVSLTGATKPATAMLKELGIITEDGSNKFFDAAGSAKPLAEIFQILQDATRGLSDEQKVAAYRTIFQNRALAAALDLTKSGAKGFADMNAQISQTTAWDVSQKRLNNLSGDIEILRGNLETLAITQGSTLQNFFRGIVQGITSAIQWFTNLSDSTQAWILKAIGIAGIVFVVVGAFGMFAGSVMQIIALGKQLHDSLVMLHALQKAITVAQWAMNSAVLANPITWIIVGIVALIAAFILLWRNNEGFRNFWIGLWASIVSVFQTVVAWFQGIPAWWNGIWTSVSTSVSTIWGNILAFFQSIPGMILNFFMNWTLPGLLISHWSSIWATITSVWNTILTFFQGIPDAIANFFTNLPEKVGYWIGFMIGTAIRLLLEFGNNARITITTAWEGIVTFFSELPGRIETFFVDLYNRVSNWLSQTWNNAVQIATNLYNGVSDWFAQLPGRAAQLFSEVYNNIRNWLENAKNSAVTTATNLYTGVVNWFQQLPIRVAQFFTDVYNNITQKLESAKNSALAIATNIYNGIRDAINGLPGLVTGIFDNVVSAIRGLITRAFNAVRDFAAGLWNGFKEGLGMHSPSFIEKAMWKITGTLDEETKNMRNQVKVLQGLGNGIVEMGGNLGTGFSDNFAIGLKSLQKNLTQTLDYQNQLAQIAATTTIGLSTPASAGIPTTTVAASPVIVQAGDQVQLDVTWNAAPNDQVNTRQQAKDLLGKASTILNNEVGIN